MPVLILLCGEIGAGKTSAARFIKERWRADYWNDEGQLYGRLLDQDDRERSRENLMQVALETRHNLGASFLATRRCKEYDKTDAPVIVWDGVRWLDTIEEAKLLFKPCLVFYIDAAEERRFERESKKLKDEKGQFLRREEFASWHRLAIEREVRDIRDAADEIVKNNETEEDFLFAVYTTVLRRLPDQSD